ncbi:MAG: HDIG domain-containing protein [Lentisphaeria bacterium]|nr:HDIG domain-containing protein [Lentisphaeria bacterium]
MSEEKKKKKEMFEHIGAWMQRSLIVSLLMILMVFGAAVALLWIPSQSDLPSIEKGSQAAQDIEAVCDFSYQNKKEATRIFQTFALEFPRYFRFDPERSEKIIKGYELLMQEVLRRNAAEEERKAYVAPENADPETAAMVSFVQEMPPLLYFFLRQTALDDVRKEKASAQVEEIVFGGIATADERNKAQPFTGKLSEGEGARTVNAQMNAKILDSDSREVGPFKLSDLPTPEIAAEQTVNSLLSTVSYDQRVPYEEPLLRFFRVLYADGNLTYDADLSKQRMDEEFAEMPKEVREPEIFHKKGTILIHKNETLNEDQAEMYKAYQIRYNDYLREQRTWNNLFQKTMLVALLIVLSCIYIVRVHPELIGNNRSVWLIGFVVIFSLLCNRLFMEQYNDFALGKGYPVVPLYLAMPLALPALVIASVYSGRSAVFAGLFVAGVSAVALDFSFPAFASGLFVCAVGTVCVRQVYDYKKFFTHSFFSCAVTMCLASLIFQQNPDFLTSVRMHDWNRLGFNLAVPLTAGLLTAMIASALIIALETVLDVTSNMSYLSLTDRNHPLLKKLQMEAPGTYHHCERVALLAEEAANCVGGVSLKAQAYALFHDVGKLASPEMFTENSNGKDMYKDLNPAESAEIICCHVEFGVQLAKKYKLKTPIRRAIECHHGNDFISFFYEKEKERTGKTPPEAPFRYPGPLPQELECVILMLADCCEAAVCSLSEPTEENVRALVEKIFNGKLQRKQLDAARITLEQLTQIRESFLKTFKSMNHTRVSYSRAKADPSGEKEKKS